jgi:hypothetical protein
MKIARLVGLTLVAVMALSLAVASAAFAEPLFLPVGATFTGTSGTATLESESLEKIKCTADTSSGEITTPHLVGGITVSFSGCKSISTAGAECTAKSVGAAAGSIKTNLLHGVLGLILPKTGSGVGLLLLPAEGKKFVTIESNKCTVETTASGNVVGEVTPIGVHTTKGELILKGAGGGHASIKDFDLSLGGLVIPKLEAFGKEASEETTEELTWSTPVEVS